MKLPYSLSSLSLSPAPLLSLQVVVIMCFQEHLTIDLSIAWGMLMYLYQKNNLTKMKNSLLAWTMIIALVFIGFSSNMIYTMTQDGYNI